MMVKKTSNKRFSVRSLPEFRSIKEGYRSGLEVEIADQLRAAGIEAEYESTKIEYVVPTKPHKYTPDFVLPSGIIIETKGRFVTADRQKHLLIKVQHPELDIRFVFSNSRAKLSKLSSTTYQMWCEKHGFQWAHRKIPEDWLKEGKNEI